RNTGKDLVQNHMTFCLFAHTAIFLKELWPRGFGVNGWVRLAGRKMSKSRGNVWYIREAVREWGADAIRLTIANAGDGLDDPNVDMDFAEAAKARIGEWLRFATAKHATRKDHRGIDARYPKALAAEVDPRAAAAEALLQSTLSDVREILKVTGIAPKRVALYTAPAWKVRVHRIARDLAKQGPIPMNGLMERVLAEPG